MFVFFAVCHAISLLTDDRFTVSWLFDVFLRNMIKVNVRARWWVGLGFVNCTHKHVCVVCD